MRLKKKEISDILVGTGTGFWDHEINVLANCMFVPSRIYPIPYRNTRNVITSVGRGLNEEGAPKHTGWSIRLYTTFC